MQIEEDEKEDGLSAHGAGGGVGQGEEREERLQRGTKDLQMKERRMIRDLETDMHGFDTV